MNGFSSDGAMAADCSAGGGTTPAPGIPCAAVMAGIPEPWKRDPAGESAAGEAGPSRNSAPGGEGILSPGFAGALADGPASGKAAIRDRALRGHLHLTCAVSADGRSVLREQSFSAPFHLSKPHDDAGALVVNVVNPTAGIFDGDELELDARVERGARLVLTTPGASRIHQSRSGRPALLRQRIRVAAGSFAEFLPEPLIPQRGAVCRQETELLAEPGGELLFFEWLSPGRVAGGEAFQYRRLDWSTAVRVGDRLAARERFTLEPARPETLTALTIRYPRAHYLGCFWIAGRPFPMDEVEDAGMQPGVYLGWSALCTGGWVVKALCADALTTRRLLGKLRAVFHSAMDGRPPRLGRL